MNWLNTVGALAAVFIAPSATIASILTAKDFAGLGEMRRNEWLAFAPSVAVIAIGFVSLLIAFRSRDRSQRFRGPRTWGRMSDVRLVHWLASKCRLDHGSRLTRHRQRINTYMTSLLNQASEASIFTRDLSWSSDPDALTALMRLAKARHLTIYVHDDVTMDMSDQLDRLSAAGAKVLAYTHPGHPNVRFTRVQVSGTTKLAIARPSGRTHRVKELHDMQDITYQMADCLLSLGGLRQIP